MAKKETYDNKNDCVLFNFSHNYDKLRYPTFTTIRSVHYMKKRNLKIGSIGWITLKRKKLFKAVIMGYRDMRICDMPIDLLKLDSKYDDFEIKDHQDFVNLLNEFNRFKNNRLTTIKRIIYLGKIEE